MPKCISDGLSCGVVMTVKEWLPSSHFRRRTTRKSLNYSIPCLVGLVKAVLLTTAWLDIVELLCYHSAVAGHAGCTRHLVAGTTRVTREKVAEKQLPVQHNYRNRETVGRCALAGQAGKLYLSSSSLPLGAGGWPWAAPTAPGAARR